MNLCINPQSQISIKLLHEYHYIFIDMAPRDASYIELKVDITEELIHNLLKEKDLIILKSNDDIGNYYEEVQLAKKPLYQFENAIFMAKRYKYKFKSFRNRVNLSDFFVSNIL